MFQSSYLTVTKSCKYCEALETCPLLVTTVVGFVVGDGSWLGDTVTGSVCLGRSTGVFWTGWPVAWGLVGSAVVVDVVWLWWDSTTGLVSAVWPNGSLNWRRCRRFFLYSLPSSVLTLYDRMSTCCSTQALNYFLSLSPCLGGTRTISPDCKGGSSLLVWL